MYSKLISVIMPTYNSSVLVKRAVDSVLSQVTNYKIELIIVDDVSSDNTVEIIQSYKDDRIRLIQRSVNGGAGAARLDGMMIAQGEMMSFLDSDDYWLPGFLERSASFLNETPSLVAVSVKQHHIVSKNINFYIPVLNQEQCKSSPQFVIDNFFAFWGKHNHIATGSVIMLTAIAKSIGGMRADLKVTEDLEFWAMVATYGKWGYIDECLFVSDGVLVTVNRGWIEKNMVRWKSAPTVENWQKRIIARLSEEQMEDFRHVQGFMARDLAYFMIQSNRCEAALETIRNYMPHIPSTRLAKLMIRCSKNRCLWLLMCSFLQVRERIRDIVMRFC
jgi:glycosyltransferase involved in cell wall biosynthesis